MNWYTLFCKIGKQNLSKMKKEKVIMIIDEEEIELQLKFNNGKMHFIRKEIDQRVNKGCDNLNEDIGKCISPKYKAPKNPTKTDRYLIDDDCDDCDDCEILQKIDKVKIEIKPLKKEIKIDIPIEIKEKLIEEDREKINLNLVELADILHDVSKR